ncbi:DUF4176 domain-containing protein [Floccifex sp.]|uniref:DUF4176 domain-containing protein n=1 Tax=Floccifex sp. TaxID=2815810 RepID=UPI002A761869|nr:DUF4176 domain-containing protein [Floccifex sp.]MDD7280863.1 DUF4176 domain-containing protein [Erysipelotrichaceae bacterium]MDY2958327.1 DUF4176 domain-containing protein [Floccifex sp.]
MKEYLPLGTIVALKNTKKRIMIVGRLQTRETDDKVYDYAAVLYPEGLIDSEHFYLFNQEDIQTLYYIGMQDEEEFNFRYRLQEQS